MNHQSPIAPALRHDYGEDANQFGELRLPAGAGPHPVVIVIHGGCWRARTDLGYIAPCCEALTAAGVATWSVEYRRVGNAGGGWPGTLEDVARAADHLRQLAPQFGLDLNRVVATGHSAGGQLALWLAARRRLPVGSPLHADAPLPLLAAAPLAGLIDLRHCWQLGLCGGMVESLLGGTPDTVPERYAAASPAAWLPLGLPQVIVNGTTDEVVPLAVAERYQAEALAAGDEATLLALPGTGHIELVDPQSAIWPRVAAAILGPLGLAAF